MSQSDDRSLVDEQQVDEQRVDEQRVDEERVDEERVDVNAVPVEPGDGGDDVPPASSGGVGIGGDSVPDTFEPEEPH